MPSVIVPVLSEHSTFMLPKFSMEESCFTMTFFAAMRLAPCARLMLMMAGSNCGVRPTASASEKMNDSSTGRCRNTLIAKMAKIRIIVTSSSR